MVTRNITTGTGGGSTLVTGRSQYKLKKLKSRTSNRETVRDLLELRRILPHTIYVIWGHLVRVLSKRLGPILGSDQHQIRGDYVLKSPVPQASQGQRKLAWDFPVPYATISVFYQSGSSRKLKQWHKAKGGPTLTVALHVKRVTRALDSHLGQNTDSPGYTPQSSSVPSGI